MLSMPPFMRQKRRFPPFIKIKEGSFIEAVKYYIKGDMQVKAVNLIIKYRIKIDNNTLTYLMNSINELGLNDIAKKLTIFMKENQ